MCLDELDRPRDPSPTAARRAAPPPREIGPGSSAPLVEPALTRRARLHRALRGFPPPAVRARTRPVARLASTSSAFDRSRMRALQYGRGRLNARRADVAGDALERVGQPLRERMVAVWRGRRRSDRARGPCCSTNWRRSLQVELSGFRRRGPGHRSCRGRRSTAGLPAAPDWTADRGAGATSARGL